MPLDRSTIDRTLASPAGEAAFEVAAALLDAGHECWWVGGAPRDMFLGKVLADIDMAVSAKPDQVAALFPKCDSTHADLGTVIISVKGHSFELTTFRSDDDVTDGRRPVAVRFGTREEEAIRRDATVNAMYWNPVSRELFDPCGGEQDLRERIVRFIGDPVTRIRQDALRILRVVRLKTLIGGQYHPETYAALVQEAACAKTLSGTRVLEELEKILKLPKPSAALRDLADMSILKEILPEIALCKGVAQPRDYHREGDVFEHLMRCVDAATQDHAADVRIAALLHDTGKVETFSLTDRIHFDHHAEASAKLATSMLQKLRMPTARIEKITWLITHHMMMGTFENLQDERKSHWYFHPWFQELLQLFWLDVAGTVPADFALYESIIGDYDEFLNSHPRPAKPLLNGHEVMALLGVGASEQVGKVLQTLQNAQVRKEITTKKEAETFVLRLSREGRTIDR